MGAIEQSFRELLTDGPGALPSGIVAGSNARHRSGARPESRLPGLVRPEDAARLCAVLDRSTAFYVTDPGGNFVAYNQPFAEIAPQVFASGDAAPVRLSAGAPDGLMAIVERLHVDRREIRRSHALERDRATTYLVARHFVLEDDNGAVIGFGGTFEDVTPLAGATRKATEMEGWLQDVIRSASDWVWAVDGNFNLTFASPRISEALGTPAQMLRGRHLFSLGAFADDPAAQRTKAEMERYSPFRGRLFLMKDSTGETRHVLLSGVPVFDDASGRFQGYRGTGTDVTRQHHAENAVRKANSELERTLQTLRQRNEDLAIALERTRVADQAKMDFLAMMSHELKTPLNSIIGFSDAAMQKIHGELGSGYLEYFSNIHKAGRHLLAIISDILDTANIEKQHLTIDVAPIRVGSLIREALSLIDLTAVGRTLDTSAILTDSDSAVLVDHLRARQILVNLIGNALKFTPDGGKVGIDVGEQPGRLAAITVWDTGIGIPADEQERVFERFYQVEKNILSRGTEGTGLGLSISRHLARLMGGDLKVSSRPGEGSRFTLLLPLVPPLRPQATS